MKGVRKLFKMRLLFWQNNKLRYCVYYNPGSAVWVQHSTTTWPWQCALLKNFCVITKSSGRSAWLRFGKLKAIVMGRDGPRGCCRKKALPSQLPAVCAGGCTGLQYCLCSTGYGGSAVAGELHRRLPVSGIATELSNGSVQPPGSCQKEMSAMYRHGKRICWADSYSVLSPKVIKLLQIEVSPNRSQSPVVMMMMMILMILIIYMA